MCSQGRSLLDLTGAAFLEFGLDVEGALMRVAQGVAHLLQKGCLVLLLSPDHHALVPTVIAHPDVGSLPRFRQLLMAAPVPAGKGIYAEALRAADPIAVRVEDRAFRRAHAQEAMALEEAGVRRILLMALRTPRGPLGVIGLSEDAPEDDVTAIDRPLLKELAARLALSIENARLLDQERKARGKAELAAWAQREKVDELETSQALFRSAFEGASKGMAILSPEWTILRVNRPFLDLLQYQDTELLHAPFLSLVHVEDEVALRPEMRAAKECGSLRRPVRFRRKDGSHVTVHLSATLARDFSGAPHAIVIHADPLTTPPAPSLGDRKVSLEDLWEMGRLFSNPVNLRILQVLHARPSYPRALARDLGRSERDIQRKLHMLEKAGLVAGVWRRHEGRAVKVYQTTTRTFVVEMA